VVNWIEDEHCQGTLLYTFIISMEKWRKTMDSTSGFLTARSLKYDGLLTTQLLCLVVVSVAVTVSRTLLHTHCRSLSAETTDRIPCRYNH
jgi:hypothetical protein